MNDPPETVAELARIVTELERIADDADDDETAYRFEEAIRHIEIGVGEWASTGPGTGAVTGDRFDLE